MLFNAIMQLEINKGEKIMYLVIEKIDFVNISPSFNVVFYAKEMSLATKFAECKQQEAEEQGKENYYYDVVEFMSGNLSTVIPLVKHDGTLNVKN